MISIYDRAQQLVNQGRFETTSEALSWLAKRPRKKKVTGAATVKPVEVKQFKYWWQDKD